jgi:hypothetical protein
LLGQHGVAVNHLKAQLGTAMLGLALVQLTLTLWMYRRLPGAGAAPPPVPLLHRLGGASCFPALLAGRCALHVHLRRAAERPASGGAFGRRLLVLRRVRGQGADRPEPPAAGWALPVAGGLLVTLIAVIWYSSALWYFNGFRLPLP